MIKGKSNTIKIMTPGIQVTKPLFFAYAFHKVGVYQGTTEAQPSHTAERDRKLLKKEIRPLVAYPCVYLILSVFALINRLVIFKPKH